MTYWGVGRRAVFGHVGFAKGNGLACQTGMGDAFVCALFCGKHDGGQRRSWQRTEFFPVLSVIYAGQIEC